MGSVVDLGCGDGAVLQVRHTCHTTVSRSRLKGDG